MHADVRGTGRPGNLLWKYKERRSSGHPEKKRLSLRHLPDCAESDRQNGKCGKCPFLEYCMGGCPAMAMLSTADTNPLAPNPLKCFFYENGYYEKFVSALPGWYNLSVMELK